MAYVMSGGNVRGWRAAMRLRTQRDAAEVLDVSLRTYQRMERDGATVLESLALRALYHSLVPKGWDHSAASW